MNTESLDRLREAIGDYIRKNGREYDRLLVSVAFHNRLKKEAGEHDIPLDFPNMEVKEQADYDFKLLP